VIERLPYTLTNGVTATRDGLKIDASVNPIAYYIMGGPGLYRIPDFTISWSDVAECLRYREGGPWCACNGRNGLFHCGTAALSDEDGDKQGALHRFAAILCDGAEAFRVLHWCLHNLSGCAIHSNWYRQ